MRVDWCVSSWFRIKNTHSHTYAPMSGQMNSAPRARDTEGSTNRTPSLALVPPSAYPMRERSPVPCAQPSPRRDAPSPLAFAKSCKGGDVSVLDAALAWDVRYIYLQTGHLNDEEIRVRV